MPADFIGEMEYEKDSSKVCVTSLKRRIGTTSHGIERTTSNRSRFSSSVVTKIGFMGMISKQNNNRHHVDLHLVQRTARQVKSNIKC